MSANRIVSGAFGLLSAREAIASVAASHEPGCICLTCRAAGGDEAAFAEIVQAVGALADAGVEDPG